jgi:Ca2+ transporting ATPase
VLKHFDVQEASGLDNSSVTASRQKHGRNGMFSVKPTMTALNKS